MSLAPCPPVIYRLDKGNRLISLNDAWTDFAEANDGSGIVPPQVIGRSIMDYISDMETKHLYKAILDKVRRSGRSVIVSFRCDAPEERRFMELEISPTAEDAQALDCVCRRVKSEVRAPVRLLMDSTLRTDDLLIMCSWCKQIKVHESWFEVEEAVDRLGLFYSKRLPRISHGCCPVCRKEYMNLPFTLKDA